MGGVEIFFDTVPEGSGDEDPLVFVAVSEHDDFEIPFTYNGQSVSLGRVFPLEIPPKWPLEAQ